MTIEAAKPEQVQEIAESFGIKLNGEDAASFAGLMNGIKASYDRLDELVEPTLPVNYDRSPGYRPSEDENPHNAWYWKTEITGAPTGGTFTLTFEGATTAAIAYNAAAAAVESALETRGAVAALAVDAQQYGMVRAGRALPLRGHLAREQEHLDPFGQRRRDRFWRA